MLDDRPHWQSSVSARQMPEQHTSRQRTIILPGMAAQSGSGSPLRGPLFISKWPRQVFRDEMSLASGVWRDGVMPGMSTQGHPRHGFVNADSCHADLRLHATCGMNRC